MQIRSFRGLGEPAWVNAPPKCALSIGTRSAQSIRASGQSAASTGRTRDRTRPMLQQRQKVLARAPSTRDPKRTWTALNSADARIDARGSRKGGSSWTNDLVAGVVPEGAVGLGVGARVDHEQEIALMDDLPVLEMNLSQRTADLHIQLDLINRRELAEHAGAGFDFSNECGSPSPAREASGSRQYRDFDHV